MSKKTVIADKHCISLRIEYKDWLAVPVVDEAAAAVGLPLVALHDGRLPRHRGRRRRGAVVAGRADHPRLAGLAAGARVPIGAGGPRFHGRVTGWMSSVVKLLTPCDDDPRGFNQDSEDETDLSKAATQWNYDCLA